MLGRRRRGREPQPDPAEVYRGLRAAVLGVVETGHLHPSPEHPMLVGVVIDIPSEGGFVTIVALADDTTSMYTSVGGGVIGAGHHAPVAAATHELLRTAAGHSAAFAEPDDGGLPPPGWVRLHALMASGRGRCDVPDAAFWGREDHDLLPVIAAAQDLLTRISEAAPAAGS